MFVFYEPTTLRIIHLVTHAPPDYAAFLATVPDQHWIESDTTMSFDEMELMPDLTIRQRQPMNIEAPAHTMLGSDITISGVPEGVSITVNGISQGAMDNSGVIDFTPQTAGNYLFRFEGSGYLPKEISIEVIA